MSAASSSSSSSSNSSKWRSGAAADGPRVGFELNVEQRSLSFPPGTPTDLMNMSMFGEMPDEFDIPISSPIDVMHKVRRLLFASDTSGHRDITTQMVLLLAAEHHVHPDSVRAVVTHVLRRLEHGHPFTSLTSAALTDPSKPPNHSINAMYRIFVDNRQRKDQSRRPTSLEKEYVASDAAHFVYETMPDPAASLPFRVHLVSVGPRIGSDVMTRVREACSKIQQPDTRWFQAVLEAFGGRVSPRVVLRMCIRLVENMQRDFVSNEIVFEKENQFVRLIQPRTKPIKVKSCLQALQSIAGQQGPDLPQLRCKMCNIRPITMVCTHCGEKRWCAPLCMSIEWERTHKNQCPVFQRDQPPGGMPSVGDRVEAVAVPVPEWLRRSYAASDPSIPFFAPRAPAPAPAPAPASSSSALPPGGVPW